MLFHNEAGRRLSRVEFRYDDTGHLVEEAQINEQDALPAEMLASLNPMQMSAIRASFNGSPRTHRYDGKGRRIETRTRMGPFMSETKTMAYNDYGRRNSGSLRGGVPRVFLRRRGPAFRFADS